MKTFPLKGVIAIIANNAAEMDQAMDWKLTCVEIRADLLLDTGHSLEEVMGMVESTVSKGLGSLFTLRHPEHGGKFLGSERERSEINQNALEAGADIIDLEWGSDAAAAMIEKEAPIIISHHDFERMPGVLELKKMASEMEVCGPNAIKLVPTASTLKQSVQMLKWVEEAADGIPRIGFAMGLNGACSRLLTMVYGAPITYASFGDAVAPGQLSMDSMMKHFRVPELNKETRCYALAGADANNSPVLESMNRSMQKHRLNTLCLPLGTSDLEELMPILDELRIEGVQLEDPLKHQAIEKFADKGLDAGESLFLEVSQNQEKKEFRLLPMSGEEFLEKVHG